MKRNKYFNMYISTLKNILLCAIIADSILIAAFDADALTTVCFTIHAFFVFFVFYSVCAYTAMRMTRNEGDEQSDETEE